MGYYNDYAERIAQAYINLLEADLFTTEQARSFGFTPESIIDARDQKIPCITTLRE